MALHGIAALAGEMLNDKKITDNSLDRRIALGIEKGGVEGTDIWIILDFSTGETKLSEIRQCAKFNDPDAELGVELVITAAVDVWGKIAEGGNAAAVLAADKREIFIAGKLAYFIRHVRSLIDLISTFSQALKIARSLK